MPKGTMRRREREHLVETQNMSGSSQEREHPISHTKKRHVAGEGETLSSPLPPRRQPESKSRQRVDRARHRQETEGVANGRRRRRRQQETLKASLVEDAEGVANMRR